LPTRKVDDRRCDGASLALTTRECQPGGTDVPTYQYACTACGEELEAVQKFTDPSLTECPKCSGPLRKVFSAVGVVFKGSGFYKNDSRATTMTSDKPAEKKSDTTSEKKSETKSESTPKPKGESSTSSTPAAKTA
jgi:putative FmdB family regulatory protein